MRSFFMLFPVVALTALAFEGEASACGGCFVPSETVTVVNDHRMILSIGKGQSTLWDQIRYEGDPASFAWVLPIAGTVDVGISADIVFSALDQNTQTRVVAPPQNCPPRPSDCDDRSAFASGATADAGSAGPGIQVLKEEVVGPYETKQLAIVKPDGTPDPQVLEQWLADNGYAIPEDVKPVIAKYVAEQFNFFVMKLLPGKGVKDMRPVRVTSTGANAVLPLRMVAAGTGPVVGISLWVIGEGRYEPQNFPSFVIDTNELVWDWAQNKSNYTELRAQKTAAGNGRIWEIENSTTPWRASIEQTIRSGSWPRSGAYPQTEEERAAIDYVADGNKTAVEVRDDDLAALFGSASSPYTNSTVRITRMRADLTHAALDQDLMMTAGSQDEVPLVRQIVKEANQPLCPVWDGCESVGTAPRDEAAARTSSNNSSCNVARAGNPTFIGAALGFVAMAIGRSIRRRRTVC